MNMLGLYPTWYEPVLGSGWVLGIISVVHLLASHISVGAALVSTWLATLAVRRNRPELLDYDIFTYPVHFDAYSTLLFFLTFAAVGGTAVAFSVAIAWEAGKTAGVYTASPLVERLGRASLAALGVWIAQYFLFGFLTLIS